MRILVIEDEVKIAQALKRGLEQETYAVDVVFDSEDGLDHVLSGEYDLIILDRMLPGQLDGVDICRQARDQSIHTPIIMLTARDQVRDRTGGLDAGADDYLVKPFELEELLARIRALLRRPKTTLDTVLQIGDLTLNTTSHEVKRAGSSVALSSREYALLEYLLRNQGRVITKEAIIAHVWDFEADILPNTVEVYIGYLRSKIDRPFSGPKLFHTVRGFGYQLEAKK